MIAPPRSTFAPRRRRALASAGALVCLAAGSCRQTDAGAADSALARDLTLASTAAAAPIRPAVVPFADTAVTSPTPASAPAPTRLSTTPRPHAATPTPRRTPEPRVAEAPAPTTTVKPPTAPSLAVAPHDSAPAAAPVAAGHTYGAGTGMVVATAQPICSSSNHAGDRFVASLREPIAAADGGVLPAGTDVVLELTSVIVGPAERGRVQLAARGISIGGFIRPIDAEVAWVDTTLERWPLASPRGGSDAGKVGRGAMTGAILGRVFGGGMKGTVIGAAGGAAAGAASAHHGTHYEGCLPKGTPVRIRLTSALKVDA